MLGFLNVYKEKGITSHDVVNRLRKIAGIKQIGHGGTLDPLAEGVMAVAIGKACRLLQYLTDDKCYLAEVKLGLATDTDDTEGKTLSLCRDLSHITEGQVKDALATFAGQQHQIPPIYSAIKKGGVKMYELARKGETPSEIEARQVNIYSIEFLGYAAPFARFRVACSKGTYIRSIARDLGTILGCGGALSMLLREQSGPFRVEKSSRLEQLQSDKAALPQALMSPEAALAFDTLKLQPESAKKLAHGQALDTVTLGLPPLDKEMYIVYCDEKPVALARVKDTVLQPEIVLTNAGDI